MVGDGYCRLQMPLKLALAVRGQWLGIGWAPWRGSLGGGTFSILRVHMNMPQLMSQVDVWLQ